MVFGGGGGGGGGEETDEGAAMEDSPPFILATSSSSPSPTLDRTRGSCQRRLLRTRYPRNAAWIFMAASLFSRACSMSAACLWTSLTLGTGVELATPTRLARGRGLCEETGEEEGRREWEGWGGEGWSPGLEYWLSLNRFASAMIFFLSSNADWVSACIRCSRLLGLFSLVTSGSSLGECGEPLWCVENSD